MAIENKIIADNYKKLQSTITLSDNYNIDILAYKVYIHSLDISFTPSNNMELGILHLLQSVINIVDNIQDTNTIRRVISATVFIIPFAQDKLPNKKRRSVAYIEKIAHSFDDIIEVAVKNNLQQISDFKRIINLICDYPPLSKYIMINTKSIL